MSGLKDRLEERARQKTRRARQAYVKQTQAKLTGNCKHAGKRIGTGLRHCKLAAMGELENDAMSCHDQKACYCPDFEPATSVEQAKKNFSQMELEELSIRWPSLGECLRILDMVKEEHESVSTNLGERSCDGAEAAASEGDSVHVQSDVIDGCGDRVVEDEDSEEDDGGSDEESTGDSVEEESSMPVAALR